MLSPSKLHAIKQIQTNVRQPELYLTVSAFILLKCYFINYTYLCGMCPSLHKVRSFLQSQQEQEEQRGQTMEAVRVGLLTAVVGYLMKS